MRTYLANAARVEYPTALLRYKLDVPSACCGVFDSAGMMLGTFAINRFGNRLQENAICGAFIGLFGLGSTTLISGFLPKSEIAFGIFVFLCFGMGISAVLYNIPYIAYMQETIPLKYHGRAFSLLNSIISMTMPLGLLIAGPVSEIKGIPFWFVFSGIVIVSTILISVSVLVKKSFTHCPQQ